jgi:hypothetical protein
MIRAAVAICFVPVALISSACQNAEAVQSAPAAVVVEAGECGAKGQKECPTQRWMKATVQSYQRAADWDRLASALDELALKAPAGFEGWKQTAEQGAAAARQKNDEGVRQTCRSCHDEHREKFRASLRKHVLFGI